MAFRFFAGGFKISQRRFLAVTLLASGTLAWFFVLNAYQLDIWQNLTPDETLWTMVGQVLFLGFAVFWALIGSLIGGKTNRRKLLLSWILLGILTTMSMAFFQGKTFSIISSSLLGLSLGLGLPSSMALIADYTVIEERARVSGIIILVTFLTAFITIAVSEIFGLGIVGTILLAAALRSMSLLALILDKCDREEEKEERRISRKAYREFSFYLFPWVLFIISAGLAVNIIPRTSDYLWAHTIGEILRAVFIAIFGLTTGFIADRYGRKPPLIVGLMMLVASFALIGFNMSPTTAVIFYAVSSVAWGSFFVVFLSVPGDLSTSSSREKYYAAGTILPMIILLGISSEIFQGYPALLGSFPPASLSYVLSLILFLSIIPLLRAKETLPESQIRARKMKEYLDKLGKLVKESRKAN